MGRGTAAGSHFRKFMMLAEKAVYRLTFDPRGEPGALAAHGGICAGVQG